MSPARAFAYDPADSDRVRRQKLAIFVVAGACTLAGGVWTAMYWVVFGWTLTTALPLAFVVIVGSALVVSHVTKNHYFAVYAQIICIMYVTAFIQWSMGGVFDSGFVLAWAFCGPISALVFFSVRRSVIWFVLFVLNVVITVIFDETFRRHGIEVTEGTRHVFFVMNLGVSSLVVFYFASYYVLSAATERHRAEALQQSIEDDKAKQLGPYTLERKLGAGGMGVVYRARHALLRRKTAIKLLADTNGDAQHFRRFEREVQLTSELSHPNIVAVYDYGHSPEGEFYYAMEHLPGVDLESLVGKDGPISAARAVPILRQIADALDAAHHRGLIHRDIKPANVILSRFGKRTDVVKVLDFGLVKEMDQDTNLTAENSLCGTPAYVAPETLVSPDEVGPSCDIYALGAVGYFLLVGRPVFSGKTVAEICGHHIHTPAPAPSSLSELEIPAELDRVLLRCLAKDPGERFGTAAAVSEALAGIALPREWDSAQASTWWDRFETYRQEHSEPSGEISRQTKITIALADR